MVQRVFQEVLTETVIKETENLLTLIIFGGFLISTLSRLFTIFAMADRKLTMRIFYAAVFGLVVNLGFWFVVAYLRIIDEYPTIIPVPTSTSFFGSILERGYLYLFALPQIITTYAAYLHASVMSFWVCTDISFMLFYTIFLQLFGGQV
jgi:hypothetical protein